MVAALSLCLGQVMAQTDEPRVALPPDSLLGERPNFAEMPNPEEVAKRQTDRLKEALQLDEKQYEKVYELNLKEQKERLEERMQSPHLMGGKAVVLCLPVGTGSRRWKMTSRLRWVKGSGLPCLRTKIEKKEPKS